MCIIFLKTMHMEGVEDGGNAAVSEHGRKCS